MSDPDPIIPGGDVKPVLLEDVLTALQKTFSRISSTTQLNVNENPGSPTARLGRLVDFDATVRVSPHEQDYLKVEANGPIDLRIKGQIQNDIEYVLDEPAAPQTPTLSPDNA